MVGGVEAAVRGGSSTPDRGAGPPAGPPSPAGPPAAGEGRRGSTSPSPATGGGRPRLVVYATGLAIDQAHRLGAERPLENLVEEGILAGRKWGGVRQTYVGVEGGLVAAMERAASPLTGRKVWRVVSVRRLAGGAA